MLLRLKIRVTGDPLALKGLKRNLRLIAFRRQKRRVRFFMKKMQVKPKRLKLRLYRKISVAKRRKSHNLKKCLTHIA